MFVWSFGPLMRQSEVGERGKDPALSRDQAMGVAPRSDVTLCTSTPQLPLKTHLIETIRILTEGHWGV